MDFSFGEEQQMLREQARSWLSERMPADRVAAIADSQEGFDEIAWKEIAELGWTALSLPEAHGGSGMDFMTDAVLFEELGYGLYPGPFFSTVAIAMPLVAPVPEVASAVAAGTALVAVAAAEPGGRSSLDVPEDLTTEVTRDDGTWRITGAKHLVVDAGTATHLAVVARSDEGAGIWLVDAAEVDVEVLSTMDATRPLGRVSLSSARGDVLVAPGGASAALRRVRLRAFAALALEAVGIAQRVTEMAVAHAKERRQFDKPIGAYQAVSHQIADGFVATELARSLAYWAAWCVTEEEGASRAAPTAKAFAAEAAVTACESSIQVHGGIGFTWEHPLHRFYKRAQWIAAFDGSPAVQRAEVAALLLE